MEMFQTIIVFIIAFWVADLMCKWLDDNDDR